MTIILVMIVAFAVQDKDIRVKAEMPSIAACQEEALSYIEKMKDNARKAGAIGVAAACEVHFAHEQEG